MNQSSALFCAIALSFSPAAFAFQEIMPQAAYVGVTNAGAYIIDVRTDGEFIWVGHPNVDNIVNISSMIESNNKFVENPNFVADVDKVFGQNKQIPLITMCRSGVRSMAAAEKLEAAGYTNVYSMTEGFEGDGKDSNGNRSINGWKNSNLPMKTSSIGASNVYKNISDTVTLSENFNLRIPFISYPSASASTLSIGADLEYSHSENNIMYWKLKSHTINP